jgi:hypothetical protein
MRTAAFRPDAPGETPREADHAVVFFGEPISSRYVLIQHDHLANVTRLAHERWKRAHPKFCRRMGTR